MSFRNRQVFMGNAEIRTAIEIRPLNTDPKVNEILSVLWHP